MGKGNGKTVAPDSANLETTVAPLVFEHGMEWKADGETIGTVDIDFAGTISVNGKALNEAATRFIVDWGFKQPLMNSYAFTKEQKASGKCPTPADAFEKLLAKILAGDVSVESRARVTPLMAEMREIVEHDLWQVRNHKSLAVARKTKGWLKLVDATVAEYRAIVEPVAAKRIADRIQPLGLLASLKASVAKEVSA